MFSVLLFPVAVAVALVALVVVICLSVLFTPIFIFLILPFLVVAKCRYFDMKKKSETKGKLTYENLTCF